MTADHILGLLRNKHSEDVFVPECKDGPSGGQFCRLDAWVMPKSWANSALTGYEIKVSRSDFIRDEKWKHYLPMCNYLYFVTPPGIIDPAELTPEVGLYETSKTGSRLFLRRKAQMREIAEPASVYRYVLMWRAIIRGEAGGENKRAYWESWMRDKQVDAAFGHSASKAIKQRVIEEVLLTRRENERLTEQHKNYDAIRSTLISMGLSEDCASWRFESKLKELMGGLSGEDRRAIAKCSELLSDITKKLISQ